MGMELTHTFTVPASPEQTWALLTDLEQVGSCFPGATVTETDGDTFSGTVKVKLGPIQMQYAGTGSFLERDDSAHRAVLEGKGKDKRGNGTANATATMSLTPDGDGTTVEVVTDLVVTGKPAQFGRGVMQDVSDKLLGRFVDCLESTLGADEPAEAVEPGPAPDQPEVASAVEAAAAAGPPAESTEAAGAPTEPAEAARAPADPTEAAGAPAEPAEAAGAPAEPAEAAAPSSDSPADPSPGPTGSEAPPLAQPRPPASARARQPHSSDDAIDLGDLVGPVLRERYGTALVTGVIGLVLGILIGRALRRE